MHSTIIANVATRDANLQTADQIADIDPFGADRLISDAMDAEDRALASPAACAADVLAKWRLLRAALEQDDASDHTIGIADSIERDLIAMGGALAC